MTVYADASLIFSAYTAEAASDRAQLWLAGLPAGELLTSDWCRTEIASALAIKERTGQLSPAVRRVVAGGIFEMLRTGATTVPITARQFAAAVDMLERGDRPLRSGDTLHLAVAASAGATLWTLDRRMVEAGQALGLDVRLLS